MRPSRIWRHLPPHRRIRPTRVLQRRYPRRYHGALRLGYVAALASAGSGSKGRRTAYPEYRPTLAKLSMAGGRRRYDTRPSVDQEEPKAGATPGV